MDEAASRRRTLVRMLRELSLDQDPVQSVNRYAAGMRMLYGGQAMLSVSRRGLPPGQYRVMRFLHQSGVAEEGFADLLFAGEQAGIAVGGVIGEIVAQQEPVVIRDLRCDNDPALGAQLRPYRLLVAVPVFAEGEIGNWVMYLNTDPNAFTDDDVEARILQSNLMGGITYGKRVTQELRSATAWINQQVDEIASLQKALLPESLPGNALFEMAACYGTYARAGGDYYAAYETAVHGEEEPWLLFFIADASGHGPSAAFLTAMVDALLHSQPQPVRGPGAVLDFLNQRLCKRHINYSFVTAFAGLLHPQRRMLRYASAGHPPPFLRDTDGGVSQIAQTGNVPLGILADGKHEEREARLSNGDTLLCYTDGITEARNTSGALFEEERLHDALAAAGPGAAQLLKDIQRDLRAFQGNQPQPDDQTMLVIRLMP